MKTATAVVGTFRMIHLQSQDGQARNAGKAAGTSTDKSGQNSVSFDEDYLARLRSGDDETAKHFDSYFRRLLRLKLWGTFSRERAEDVVEEVMAVAVEKILHGEPQDARCLAGYIHGICSNLIKREIRLHPSGERVDLNFDRMSDGSKTAEESLLKKEKAETVRKVLGTLRARDRNTLVDLFYHELSRHEVCEKYGVTTSQLRMILFHARRRFQKHWAANA